jgi:phospholipid/cholesterol/gamma-HCH transport system permease protein
MLLHGNRSLLLVAVTFIIYLAITSYSSRVWRRVVDAIHGSIIREIGPIITALICAGRIGSGIGAELGSMRVTEQIDAMEVSGTNPFKYLVVTRIMATTLMLPILVFLEMLFRIVSG